jgi:2-iminoacetate synthase
MKNKSEELKIKDVRMQEFIDAKEIWSLINNSTPSKEKVRDIISKSLHKERLSLEETAILVNTKDEELVDEIKQGAEKLKKEIYGDRIVVFAPLYIGNLCTNNCIYCAYKHSNKDVERVSLSDNEIVDEVKALIDTGHKRLILVFGEHPNYDPEFISNSVNSVYKVKHLNGEIRRVNINAAPFDIEGFKKIKNAKIGTYQVFQETYHQESYHKFHPSGKKNNYNWRLTALDRAMEAGIDDVGIGALFGLYDWRFEVLSLIRHTIHLENVYHTGPHTISFPRIQDAHNVNLNQSYLVNDKDFVKLAAILRLAVPYTGLIITAREKTTVKDEIIKYGASQIDAGVDIKMKGYTNAANSQNPEQFQINDNRTLSEMVNNLISTGQIPSFCTACYRRGRTGEHFMEFSESGFIKNFCAPNAILTLSEYLLDYASNESKEIGFKLLDEKIDELEKTQNVTKLRKRYSEIKKGKRDLSF